MFQDAKPTLSGPVDVLVKTKWCGANAAVLGHHFGLSLLDVDAVDAVGDGTEGGPAIPEGPRTVLIKKEASQGLGISIKGGRENRWDGVRRCATRFCLWYPDPRLFSRPECRSSSPASSRGWPRSCPDSSSWETPF